MGRAVVALLVMLGAAAAAAPIQKIRNNLFLVTATEGNVAVFVTRTGVVLAAGDVPEDGQPIVDAVRSVSDNPVTMIVPTGGRRSIEGSRFFAASVEIVRRDGDRTRAAFGRGRDAVDVRWFGTGATSVAVVLFPGVRAMYVGDPARLGAAGERIVREIPDVDTVIAAHGDVMTWAAFAASAAPRR